MDGIEIIRPNDLESMDANERVACVEASFAALLIEFPEIGFDPVETISGAIRALGIALSAAQLSKHFSPPDGELEVALHEAIRAFELYGRLLEAQA